MYELAVALKYLIPRWRQLSVSLISLVSIFVISLVVWLIVVFFSVTEGLEKGWTQKLITLTAPVRLTPTPAYYQSYYYLIDELSEAANYSLKTLSEKRKAESSDPYDPDGDEELPSILPAPDLDASGNLKDIVKLAFSAIEEEKFAAADFEVAIANLKLHLNHDLSSTEIGAKASAAGATILSQTSYLTSYDPNHLDFKKSLLPLRQQDKEHLWRALMTALKGQNSIPLPLISFLKNLAAEEWRTPPYGWEVPPSFLPVDYDLEAIALIKDNQIYRLYFPKERSQFKQALSDFKELYTCIPVHYRRQNGSESLLSFDGQALPPTSPKLSLQIAGNLPLTAEFPASLKSMPIKESERESERQELAPFELKVAVQARIQGQLFSGLIPLTQLQINLGQNSSSSLWWDPLLENDQSLPTDRTLGYGILLAKSFQESGALVGDRGYLSYFAPAASGMQEQRIPLFIAGFYDPGIIPIGGKTLVVDQAVTAIIRSSQPLEDSLIANGIYVRATAQEAPKVAARLKEKFKNLGIDRYWQIETFREYEFTKPLFQQLQSEKNIFSLIAMIIIIVACSNIVSMLIILVNDKKLEIGILRSMGASSYSIALIFGSLGLILGILSSLIGTLLAFFTLRHFKWLIDHLSWWQGYAVFDETFYGGIIPESLSSEALSFVLIATLLISLIAALCPAIKAARLPLSAILKGS